MWIRRNIIRYYLTPRFACVKLVFVINHCKIYYKFSIIRLSSGKCTVFLGFFGVAVSNLPIRSLSHICISIGSFYVADY